MDIGVTGLLESPSHQAGATARVENTRLPVGNQGYEMPAGFAVCNVTQVIDKVMIVGRCPVIEQCLLVAGIIVNFFKPRIDFIGRGQVDSSTNVVCGSKYINFCFDYHIADRAKKNPALLQVTGLVIKQLPVPYRFLGSEEADNG